MRKSKFKISITHLCKVAGVSRSGYYRYHSLTATLCRAYLERQDLEARDDLLVAYHFKNRNKGARQIKMTLENQFSRVMNLKKISRLMKKYDIICPIRRANPYKKMMKATKDHRVVKNILNQQFEQATPGKVFLTDITYLFYGKGQKAYLSTIKDCATNEIVAYDISKNIMLDLVTETIQKLLDNPQVKIMPGAYIHSDQGAHYTSPCFQSLLKEKNLGQSMSRRGNCWGNAPQESFFGHFKDEARIKKCQTYDELKEEINDYMDYYNNYRYQWGLKKMTPVQYRNHLLKVS